MTDPRRFADSGSEAPEALRTLLQTGREELPGGERLQGIATRLGPLFGGAAALVDPGQPDVPVGPAAPTADPAPLADPSAAASTVGGGTVAKALGVGTAIAVIAGGVWLLTRPEPVKTGPPSVSAPGLQAPAAIPPESRPSAAAAAPAAPSLTAAEAPGQLEPSERARPAPSGPSESALLAQAQAALGKNPSRALALTREHKRRFPNGALAQEREVIAIEALNRIGDSESARKRAQDFEQSYPGSAHRRKVQNATKQ